jgi:hypothetical protein
MSEKTICCPRDGYVWTTKSKMVRVTCPSCGYKVDAKSNRMRDDFLNLEHFNIDEKGVRILDRSLATEHSPNGRIVDVYFKERKAWCEYDDSSDCKHIEYALSLPIVKEILKKKGWKI